MATVRQSPLVGVFSERSAAENAIEQLHNTGFSDEQISYSANPAQGSFLESIKNFFTGGQTTSSTAVANDLSDMGLSDDEANYYAHEHEAGHTIVALHPGSRYLEALAILRSNGAYNGYQSGESSDLVVETPASPAYDPSAPTYDPNSRDYNQSATYDPIVGAAPVNDYDQMADYNRSAEATPYSQKPTGGYDRTADSTAYNQSTAYERQSASYNQQPADSTAYERQSASYNQQPADSTAYERQSASYNQQPADSTVYNQRTAYERQGASYNQQPVDDQAITEPSAEELLRRKLQEERLAAERARRNDPTDPGM